MQEHGGETLVFREIGVSRSGFCNKKQPEGGYFFHESMMVCLWFIDLYYPHIMATVVGTHNAAIATV
jgi:hypothetical protein